MREIKFRVWDKDNSKMVYPNQLHFENNAWNDGTGKILLNLEGVPAGYMDDDGGKSGLWEHEYDVDVELMQYTGLKDRNGQEIYEGDILKMNGGAHDFYGTVLFENGCFVFDAYWIEEGKMKPELYHYTQVKFVDCEVAGNVYQNPELLEAEGVEE